MPARLSGLSGARPNWTSRLRPLSWPPSPPTRRRAVRAVLTVEIGTIDGHVLLRITSAEDGAGAELLMTADEARELSNHLGGAIRAAARARVTI
jgi:hypothetical protein